MENLSFLGAILIAQWCSQLRDVSEETVHRRIDEIALLVKEKGKLINARVVNVFSQSAVLRAYIISQSKRLKDDGIRRQVLAAMKFSSYEEQAVSFSACCMQSSA